MQADPVFDGKDIEVVRIWRQLRQEGQISSKVGIKRCTNCQVIEVQDFRTD